MALKVKTTTQSLESMEATQADSPAEEPPEEDWDHGFSSNNQSQIDGTPNVIHLAWEIITHHHFVCHHYLFNVRKIDYNNQRISKILEPPIY